MASYEDAEIKTAAGGLHLDRHGLRSFQDASSSKARRWPAGHSSLQSDPKLSSLFTFQPLPFCQDRFQALKMNETEHMKFKVRSIALAEAVRPVSAL